MVLKEQAIARRATVFEENSLVFARNRFHAAGFPPPAGFTAAWGNRALLGIAKLAQRVESGMDEDDLASLVLTQTGLTDGDNFLEVHIYGPLHRSAVACITGKIPRNRTDRVMVLRMQRELEAAGIEVRLTL